MMLMEEAERIAREEHGSGKLAVISGEKQHSTLRGHRIVYSVLILLSHGY